MPSASPDRIQNFIVRQLWQVNIYEIWKECNNRFHNGISLHQNVIISRIIKVVRNKNNALFKSRGEVGSEACCLLVLCVTRWFRVLFPITLLTSISRWPPPFLSVHVLCFSHLFSSVVSYLFKFVFIMKTFFQKWSCAQSICLVFDKCFTYLAVYLIHENIDHIKVNSKMIIIYCNIFFMKCIYKILIFISHYIFNWLNNNLL